MPKSQITVQHQLDQQEAINRLKNFMEQIGAKFQGQVSEMEQSWSDNVMSFAFKTFGMKIDGTMAVDDNQVTVDQNLPLAAMMAKGKIEGAIREELQKILS